MPGVVFGWKESKRSANFVLYKNINQFYQYLRAEAMTFCLIIKHFGVSFRLIIKHNGIFGGIDRLKIKQGSMSKS
jgi:hypothetical protein